MEVLIGLLLVGVVAIVLVSGARTKQAAARRAALLAKYRDERIVASIHATPVWIGQNREQQLDSVGRPHDVDQKVVKTKKKEIWKYGHKGGNRYLWRIKLENDSVIGWDEKA